MIQYFVANKVIHLNLYCYENYFNVPGICLYSLLATKYWIISGNWRLHHHKEVQYRLRVLLHHHTAVNTHAHQA